MKRINAIILVVIVSVFAMIVTSCQKEEEQIEGALPGLFSVSDSKKVSFSKGNLQYQASTNTWRFAEQQYLYGDLFGWGTGNNPSLSSTNDLDYATFTDWGNNPIVNGGNAPNMWRTLTQEEWVYLLKKRPGKCGMGIVGGRTGWIILPDNWLQPSECPDFVPGNVEYNKYSLSEWMVMELAGAVFLPEAKYNSEPHTAMRGPYGEYWSSTPDGEYKAYRLYLYGYNVPVTWASEVRHNKCSVRLVH